VGAALGTAASQRITGQLQARLLTAVTAPAGGQWQRLALARALFATFHGARVLVLDEPTAALDVRAEARFYQRFHEITAGLTTLVISHRFATVRKADRIYVLDGGVITEHGRHDELVAAGGAYAEHALFERYAAAAAGYAADSGTITLLVSHRFATVRMADLIVYLEEGRAAEAGTHDELLAAGGRYAELFRLQAAGYQD
jgi:ABC-type multidrug transport system fused ATPase/permease subunit